MQATRQFLLDNSCYLDSGKVTVLLSLLEDYIKQGRKILVFSQVKHSNILNAKMLY